MPAVTNEEIYANVDRLRGRTIVITGAGSGFGRATALEFSKHGANLVLADINDSNLAATVALLKTPVVSRRCDVTSWDDQVALFAAGFDKFGSIDIILPNAGVSEVGRFDPRQEDVTKLTRPNLTTLDIDLTAVLYTTRIALWYFANDKRKDPGLRAVVFTGSMSSFYGSDGVMYGAAKAGILGIMKGIAAACLDQNIRTATVCPYFSKTAILADDFVHPNPSMGFAKVEDVTAAFVAAITDPSPKTNVGCYLIPDQWGVYRMETTGNFVGAEGARRLKKKGAKL